VPSQNRSSSENICICEKCNLKICLPIFIETFPKIGRLKMV
jgi:hypothetical protein